MYQRERYKGSNMHISSSHIYNIIDPREISLHCTVDEHSSMVGFQ
jgi:hypothetical protein